MPRLYKPQYLDPASPSFDEVKAKVWLSKHTKGQIPLSYNEAKAIVAAGGNVAVQNEITTLPTEIERNEGVREGKMNVAQITAIVPDWKKLGASVSEARFAAEYCANGFNAVEAYRCAVNPCMRHNQLLQYSSAMMTKAGVMACINAYSKGWIGDRLHQVKCKIVDTHMTQAFYDISMFVNTDGSLAFNSWEDIPPQLRCAVKSIKKKVYGKDADREEIEIELVDRLPSLGILQKLTEKMEEAGRSVESDPGKEKKDEAVISNLWEKIKTKAAEEKKKDQEIKVANAIEAEVVAQ